MKLLILFLFSIQFVFCSGVELLRNPGQLTPDQDITGGSKGPIDGLNTVVISIMGLFASPNLDNQIKDLDIIAGLNEQFTSIKEQYEHFFNTLGKLKEKFDMICLHEQQTPLQVTLNNQQNHPEIPNYQILKNNNKYMQNIIILAMNLIKGIINLYSFTLPPQQINIYYDELVKCLNEFRKETFQYMSSATQDRFIIGGIQLQQKQVNALYDQIKKRV